MGRKRPETNRSKIAKMLIEEYDCKTAGDIQYALKDFLGDTLDKSVLLFDIFLPL